MYMDTSDPDVSFFHPSAAFVIGTKVKSLVYGRGTVTDFDQTDGSPWPVVATFKDPESTTGGEVHKAYTPTGRLAHTDDIGIRDLYHESEEMPDLKAAMHALMRRAKAEQTEVRERQFKVFERNLDLCRAQTVQEMRDRFNEAWKMRPQIPKEFIDMLFAYAALEDAKAALDMATKTARSEN